MSSSDEESVPDEPVEEAVRYFTIHFMLINDFDQLFTNIGIGIQNHENVVDNGSNEVNVHLGWWIDLRPTKTKKHAPIYIAF